MTLSDTTNEPLWGSSRHGLWTHPLRIRYSMVEDHPMGGKRLKVDPFLIWSREVLGSVPVIRWIDNPDSDFDSLCAMFHTETDAELFRLAFAEWWK